MDNRSPVHTTLSQKLFPLVPLIIHTLHKNVQMSLNGLVSEMVGYGLDGSSTLCYRQNFLFSITTSKSALESPSLLFNGYRSFFPGDKVGRD
jgi:hypothetical protein